MDPERLADDVAHGHPRVEGGVRVLEDDLELATNASHLFAVEARDVAAIRDDRARSRLDQLQNRARQSRLPAARLADEPERLALLHLEIDAVDRMDLTDGPLENALSDREVLDEVLDPQDRALDRLPSAVRRDLGPNGRDPRTVAHATGSETSFDWYPSSSS